MKYFFLILNNEMEKKKFIQSLKDNLVPINIINNNDNIKNNQFLNVYLTVPETFNKLNIEARFYIFIFKNLLEMSKFSKKNNLIMKYFDKDILLL